MDSQTAATDRPFRYLRGLLFACLFVVYFSVYPYNQGLNNPNENSRIYTTIALVEHHTWRLDEELERFGPINDTAVLGGKHFAAKGPAVSVIAIPVYWLFSKVAPHFISPSDSGSWLRAATLFLRIVIVQVPSFLFLIWFFSWLRRQGIDASIALVGTAALGVGTNYLAYSLMFVSHSLSAATAFCTFTLIVSRVRPLLVGTLLGIVTLFDYQGAVVSVVLGLFALVSYESRSERALFVAGAAIQLCLLLLFQHAAFGNAFRAPFHYLEDDYLRSHHTRGFLGFGLPSATALRALCFDRTVGLFGTSPFLWLMLPGSALVWRNRDTRWAILTVVVMLLAVSGITNWRAGWSVGPRYLVTAMPFAVFIAAAGIDRFASRSAIQRGISRGLAGGLLLASTATVGLVSIVFNTLPYDISNPLVQVAIPFVRAGFVPHHAGEMMGWSSPAFFTVAVVCLFAAAVVASVALPAGHLIRWPIIGVICAIALAPSLLPRRTECPRGVRRLTEIWEPQGRDRIGQLRAAAMEQPCLWPRVAKMERSVCWPGAGEDEARSFGATCR